MDVWISRAVLIATHFGNRYSRRAQEFGCEGTRHSGILQVCVAYALDANAYTFQHIHELWTEAGQMHD